MWLQTVYGAFSIVAATQDGTAAGAIDPTKILIRGRVRSHLEALQMQFPALANDAIIESPSRDYPFRLLVSRDSFADVMKEMVAKLSYTNFKNAAAHGPVGTDTAYIDALHEVWSVLRTIERPRTQPAKTQSTLTPTTGRKRAKPIC